MVCEVGNVIWKECRARRVRDPKALAAVFGEVLSGVGVVRVGGEAIGGFLELAIDAGAHGALLPWPAFSRFPLSLL